MISIRGTLTTLSPLNIGQPGSLKITLDGRPSSQGFPCTETQKMWLPASGALSGALTPYLGANTLRGGLRRAGADLVERALEARGQKIRLATYHALRCGTIYGHPDKANPVLSEIAAARQVPIMIFGGGPKMIEGSIRVDSGFPITDATVSRGMVPLQLAAERKVEGRLTSYFWLRRADDAANFVDHQLAMQTVKDYGPSLEAWQTLLGDAVDDAEPEVSVEDAGEEEAPTKKGGKPAAASEAESKFRKLQGFNAFEAVLPGVPFAIRYDIDSDDAACVGFLLLSLANFANKQRLGGFGRIGFGRFALDLTLQTPDGSAAPALKRIGDRYEANTEHPTLAGWVAAAQQWLDTVNAKDLDALMTPSTASRDDVRKKLKNDAEALAAFDRIYG